MNAAALMLASGLALFAIPIASSGAATRLLRPRAPTIKVFALDDCDWWAGESLADCVRAGQAECGPGCYDDPDWQSELSDEALRRLTFTDEDGTVRSFADELARRVVAGDTFPSFFASTEW